MSDPTTYDVVVLHERALDAADAQELQALHEGVDEQVVYHLLLPVDDPARGIDLSVQQLGGLGGGGDLLGSPAFAMSPEVAEEVRHDLLDLARQRVEASAAAVRAAGPAGRVEARGRVVTDPPLTALERAVREVDAREVIVLTRPHVVQELLHLDWTSRAERHLDVPVLHLLAHEGTPEDGA